MNKNPLMPYFYCLVMLMSYLALGWNLPVPNEGNKETMIDRRNVVPNEETSALATAEEHIGNLYSACEVEETGLKNDVFKKAYIGFLNLKERGKVPQDATVLSIADFDLSSKEKRLWIIDVEKHQLLLNTWVSHGRGSGKDIATHFSNTVNSHQSSLGFYVTGEVYYGKHGRSLRLDGMDRGFNNKARERAIVIHGASYVSAQAIQRLDRLGLSYGCPAVPMALSNKVIDIIRDRTVLYIHANSPAYHSVFLNEEVASRRLLASFSPSSIDSLTGEL